MTAFNANIVSLRRPTKRSFVSKMASVLFVSAVNITSVYLWITTTELEWYEGFFAPTVIEVLGDSLILSYALGMRVITFAEQMKRGRKYSVRNLR